MLIKLNRDLYHIVPSSADANTYIFSRDIALQIIKKRAMLNKQRSSFILQMFTVSLIEVFMIYGLVMLLISKLVLVNTTDPFLASIWPTALEPVPIVMDVKAIIVP